MKPSPHTSFRIPVAVRVGRARFSFRMPPVHMIFSAPRFAQHHATVDVTARPGIPHLAAWLMLRVALYPLAVAAFLMRTDVEVTIGAEDAP